MPDVLPKPEKLNSTRSCELAALLVTLNFTPVDNQMTIATGDGIPGGRLGYWRFLPQHPQGKYLLDAVIKHGLNPYMARTVATAAAPVYHEQVYIAAAFHNYRMLQESLTHGTRLRLTACSRAGNPAAASLYGAVYVFERGESAAPADVPAAPELAQLMAAGTRNTELAAALSTLGFRPGDEGTTVAHELRGHVWLFPPRSHGNRWELQERMAHWADDAWCAREDNNDPIACMADAFYNLRQLRRGLKNAQVFVRVKNGGRSVLLRRDASAATWNKAEQFLTRR